MKLSFLLSLALLNAFLLIGQDRFTVLPNKYNLFVKNINISWACEVHSNHSFNLQSTHPIDIHLYLTNAKKTGLIKSYFISDFISEYNKKWIIAKTDGYFIEVNKGINKQINEGQDSLKLLEFQEIFYWGNHKLETHLISVGTEYSVVTSNGINLGTAVSSYSSLNLYPKKIAKIDEIFFLGKTYSVINFDSLESTSSLKKTYGMSLGLTIWYDLSKGYNSVLDLKTNKRILQNNVLTYSPFDSIEVIVPIDSTVPYKYKISGVKASSSFSEIGVVQNWYYNKTKNTFFNEINKTYLYIKYQDQQSFNFINEKRFQIDFKSSKNSR